MSKYKGGLVELVEAVSEEQLDELAKKIENDLHAYMQREHPHGTGATDRAISTTTPTKGMRSIGWHGDRADVAYWLNKGNRPEKGGLIRPKTAQALHFKQLDTDPEHQVWRAYSSGYEGDNFLKKIADKYR